MKTTLIAVAAAIAAIGCQAATLPFNVTAPSWNKIAECTTQGGVNIRKAPSTTAPKMVYNENSIEDYECPVIYYGYWSTKSGGAVQSITFDGIAPVVSEQPGWVELLNQGPKYESNGWVSAKYCKVSEVTPIQTSGNPYYIKFMLLNTPGIEGSYAMFLVCDDMNSEATFYLGRLDNGKVVCPYAFTCSYSFSTYDDSESTSLKNVGEDEPYYHFHASSKCMTDYQQDPNNSDFTQLETDINKVPTDIIDFAIKHAEPLPHPSYVYLYNSRYYLTD